MVFFSFAFAGAKTPLQRCHWLKKYTLNRCFLSYKRHTETALPIRCYSSRVAVVSAVSAFRVRFLTLFDNSPIFQRTYFNVFLQTLKVRPPFVSVVSAGVV